MRAFAFYGDVPQLDLAEQKRLEILWCQQWSKLGFEPIVINEWHAMQHPEYGDLSAAYMKLPSVNPKPYDYLCLIRWLSMAMAPIPNGELCVMADTDVMVYQSEPFHHYGTKSTKAKPFDRLVFFQKYVPSCVLGHRALFEAQAKRFAQYVPDEKDMHETTPHVSDQNILERQAGTDPDSFVRLDLVKGYLEPGWEAAPAIHYANSCCGPAGKTPRSKHIPLLRI